MSLRDDLILTDNDSDTIIIDRDDVSNYNSGQILPLDAETLQKIRGWLDPTSYNVAGGEYRKHLAAHVAGTGSWITSSPEYQEWLNGDEHGLLWIKGIPGSGKSVIAADLIKELAVSNPACPVLFFFFRQIIDANHEPQALLRDWMDQVLDFSPPLQQQLKTYLDNGRSLDSMSAEHMWKDLRLALAGLPAKVFCFADALDEMDQGNDTFLEALGALGRWQPAKVKVLITSRPVPAVQGPLRTSSCLQLRLRENLVDVDISKFVQFSLRRSEIPKVHWGTIVDAVPGHANGLFLYARLAMDAFLEPGADINKVLTQLPADLNILYTDLLREHARRSNVPADIQLMILQAVTHAIRPLRLLELAEMIRVCGPNGSSRDIKDTKDLIRTACGPLLEILADETVSVVHHSFTEYLKDTTRSNYSVAYPILRMGPVHAQLAVACLYYLQSGCLDFDSAGVGVSTGGELFSTRNVTTHETKLRLGYPFIDYALSNWHRHIVRSDTAGYGQVEIHAELRKFLGNDHARRAWLAMRVQGIGDKFDLQTQLHIAASTGLVSYTKDLVETAQVDAFGVGGKTPLWMAASAGHADVVRVLIAAGANPDQDDEYSGLKPLHKAALKNHHEVVTILLEAGVDPLTPKTREDPGQLCGNSARSVGYTPLMFACQNGHLESVEAFIPFVKDIETIHRALAWAARNGKSEVVGRLLQCPGVDVNAKLHGDTFLFEACRLGDVASVTTLLRAGADPNVACELLGDDAGGRMLRVRRKNRGMDTRKWNCLFALRLFDHNFDFDYDDERVGNTSEAIFALLVAAGVDLQRKGPEGQTLLHASVNSKTLLRLMLSAGADANATDDHGSTPLHLAGTAASVALLVEDGGANINVAQDDGKVPLHCMLSHGREKAALKLLEYGPNCKVTDKSGQGLMQSAVRGMREGPSLIAVLLDAGADPNERDRDGLTPVHALVRFPRGSAKGREEAIDVLLRSGADVDARDHAGETPLLMQVAMRPNIEPASLHGALTHLIDHGASLFVRNYRGRTCLHKAVAHFDRDMNSQHPGKSRLDFLLGLGLDITAVDYDGNGLIHELSMHRDMHSARRDDIVLLLRKLLALGLDMNQKNNEGRTALHLLCTADGRWIHSASPIEFFISQTRNIDEPDNNGVTPLHLAAVQGELYTKKLLDAGASPGASTHEGLTPLHLAARCRESNVVGLLLTALGRRDNVSSGDAATPSMPVEGVNAKKLANGDTLVKEESFTPLYYACRSGRPESVALLLEAGADVDASMAFNACAEFETEERLWANESLEGDRRSNLPVKLHALCRTSSGSTTDRGSRLTVNETTRLQEILKMLVKHSTDRSPFIVGHMKGCVEAAVHSKSWYAAACLKDIRDQTCDGNALKKRTSNLETLYFEHARAREKEASIQALREGQRFNYIDHGREVLIHLLRSRQYHLVAELARRGMRFLPSAQRQGKDGFSILVRLGFTALAEEIGVMETELALREGQWHAYGDASKPGLWCAQRDSPENGDGTADSPVPVPFLIEALKRELPNMGIVQLLVEKFGVFLDEMEGKQDSVDHKSCSVRPNSALHQAAAGQHWWQAHQALPYLLKAGARVDLRLYDGSTPLHVALDGFNGKRGLFYSDAAKILIESGADVNAVDSRGRSCLMMAQHDAELSAFLLDHEATVTAEALFAAIAAENAEAVRGLLSRGGDANMRMTNRPAAQAIVAHGLCHPRWLQTLEERLVYPLYYAAEMCEQCLLGEQLARRMRVVQVLLDHGADPLAPVVRQASGGGDGSSSSSSSSGYGEFPVLHDLLKMSEAILDDLITVPGLDVNRADSDGCTLLHAACDSPQGPHYVLGSHVVGHGERVRLTIFQSLVSRGADLEARDNYKRNVLHHLLSRKKLLNEDNLASMSYVIGKVPALINQADNAGETPLHCAVRRGHIHAARELLKAGADPLAVDNNRDTLLHMMAGNLGDLEELDILFRGMVKLGLDVNARNAQGATPLFMFILNAFKCRNFFEHQKQESSENGVIAMFQELGADFFARDGSGRGLLHVAAANSVDRFRELVGLGLDVRLEDDAQQTPIDVAAACGNEKVLELFEVHVDC